MTGWFRTCFVLSSFGPLYLIVWIKLWVGLGFCAPSALAFLLLSVLAVLATLFLSKRLATDFGLPMPIKNVHPVDSEVLPYLMTYIPIFLENNISDAAFLYPVLVLYSIIFIMFMKLETPHIHPYFALLGLRIYAAEHKVNSEPMIIICKGRRLSTKEEPTLHEVGTGDLYYCDMKKLDGGRDGQRTEQK